MEPILNNRLLDVNNVQSILGIPTTGKSDVVCFLEDLYTYPPKIKIQWKQLQSDSASQPNTLEALGASNKVVRNKRQPSLPKYFSRFTLPYTNLYYLLLLQNILGRKQIHHNSAISQ